MVRRLRKIIRTRAAASPAQSNFRKRYEDAERARIETLQRLTALDAKAHAHPAFKRASTLLNQSFRNAKLAQRAAVLAAAEWTIDLLETLSMIV